MGLDTVDLTLSVEKSFGITIDDRDAESIRTVGQLYDYILERMELATTDMRLAAAVFEELENALVRCGAKQDIQPVTILSDIVPGQGRRLFWRRLSQSLNLDLPNLQRTNVVVNFNLLASLLIASGVCVFLADRDVPGLQIGVAFVVGVLFIGLVLTFATRPFAVHFDKNLKTVWDLAQRVVALNAENMVGRYGAMGRGDVWEVLCVLIENSLGVDHDDITLDADFVNDLGCD